MCIQNVFKSLKYSVQSVNLHRTTDFHVLFFIPALSLDLFSLFLTNQVLITISDTMNLVPLVKSDRTEQVPLASSSNFLLQCSASCGIWQNKIGANCSFWHIGSGAPCKIWRLGTISGQIGPLNLKYLGFGISLTVFTVRKLKCAWCWNRWKKKKKWVYFPFKLVNIFLETWNMSLVHQSLLLTCELVELAILYYFGFTLALLWIYFCITFAIILHYFDITLK